MSEMHSYGVNNQAFRLKVMGWIALFSLIVSLQLQPLIDLVRTNISNALPLPRDVSPISFFTIIFTLSFIAYDRWLWKLNPFDKIPSLSGTWIGMGNNPHFELLRLELMQIDQTWTSISISVEVYQQNKSGPENWLDTVHLGTEHSTNARITECLRKYCDFNFQYIHDGEAEGQDSFGGTFFLKYKYKKMKNRKVEIHELSGKYSNTKTGKNTTTGEKFEGVVGRIAFRRVSLEILELEDALEKGKDYLNELTKEISSRISDDPDI
ncbi:MAG: hypothetical protein EWV50_18100 [Microcystis aeruginosa Ma_MB_F_20061100_S20]|uniref:Uncharacterized protein n=1 Tax=Microcystis aeruginosa Ma_MB_F_20061100_S20D TaxID=2486253 RepID=A0A552ENJ9_MICAE|nr:MAG: hypothetical protein EWV50_18100 [Microcystis aeruginosa Ma_MB_F_20061100_S20]TRU36041.1 MAG: hypothetical protein EWV78_09925 [Microcystis aeruginosa Ma_MB_F_20061100_S20D]